MTETLREDTDATKRIVISARNASGTDGGRSLLPMLIWGLVLITIGMIGLMLIV